jgi:hypothetical protein
MEDSIMQNSLNKKSIHINFADNTLNWQSNYADYSLGMEKDILFHSGQLEVPNLGINGYYLGGYNTSDDLFMFVATKITALFPNSKYSLSVSSLSIAINAHKGPGSGGSPGESVWIKVSSYNLSPEKWLKAITMYQQISTMVSKQMTG